MLATQAEDQSALRRRGRQRSTALPLSVYTSFARRGRSMDFTFSLMMPPTFGSFGDLLVFGYRHLRKMANKGHHRPQLFLVMRWTKRRHPGHLNAVLENPIQLSIIQGGCCSFKVRRLGLHVPGELRPGNSWATVTGDAAFLLEVKAASVDHLRIVKRSSQADIVAGVPFNGIGPDCLKRPTDHVSVLLAGSNIVESEIGVTCQSDDYCRQDNSDRSQGSHGLAPWRQASSRMPTVCQVNGWSHQIIPQLVITTSRAASSRPTRW